MHNIPKQFGGTALLLDTKFFSQTGSLNDTFGDRMLGSCSAGARFVAGGIGKCVYLGNLSGAQDYQTFLKCEAKAKQLHDCYLRSLLSPALLRSRLPIGRNSLP